MSYRGGGDQSCSFAWFYLDLSARCSSRFVE